MSYKGNIVYLNDNNNIACLLFMDCAGDFKNWVTISLVCRVHPNKKSIREKKLLNEDNNQLNICLFEGIISVLIFLYILGYHISFSLEMIDLCIIIFFLSLNYQTFINI